MAYFEKKTKEVSRKQKKKSFKELTEADKTSLPLRGSV